MHKSWVKEKSFMKGIKVYESKKSWVREKSLINGKKVELGKDFLG